jgi:hypothetical protein
LEYILWSVNEKVLFGFAAEDVGEWAGGVAAS